MQVHPHGDWPFIALIPALALIDFSSINELLQTAFLVVSIGFVIWKWRKELINHSKSPHNRGDE